MFVVMGATGHVGSQVANVLLNRGQDVTVITRKAEHAGHWRRRGARIAEADIRDPRSLRSALRLGRRAFLLSPPADVAEDTDAVERRTIANILEALEGSGLEKVVAASTGGARPGDRLGDLSTLWELEEGLRQQSIPSAINRGAYYMSNWDWLLGPVQETGKLSTMYPADLRIPMVAPRDLGIAAAERLQSGMGDVGVRHVEGPDRYSSLDVAQAFSKVLNRSVEVAVTPRERWQDTFLGMGFSEAAASSYTRMIGTTIDGGFDMPEDSWRGQTTLDCYIHQLAWGA